MRMLQYLTSIHLWAILIGSGIALATALSLLGSHWWVASFLEHGRFQYAIVLLIVLLISLLSQRSHWAKRWIGVWLISFAINLWFLYPFLMPIDEPPPTTQPPLRILHVTLDHGSEEVSRAIRYVESQAVDLVFFLEVTPKTAPKLQSQLRHYDLVKENPRTNSHGQALFIRKQSKSTIALQNLQIMNLPKPSPRPILRADIRFQNREISIIDFHAIRPRDAHTVDYQKLEFGALADWVNSRSLNTDVVAIGDFNSTPWTWTFHRAFDEVFINSQLGYGPQPTWPSNVPSIFQIPIDHCLHTDKLQTLQREVGPNVGSDHLPLKVALQLVPSIR